jgi:membrane-bound serine protease (ClpP class)
MTMRGKRLLLRSAWLAAIGLLCLAQVGQDGYADSKRVIRVPISGMVDFGLAPLVKRAVRQAETQGADAILIDINTLGGRVDAMIEIRDHLVEAKVLTVSWVNPRAISAGALIAMACDSLYMNPGASIGAATPVVGDTGNKASEKVVSYASSEFRGTAERKGRPAEVAAAMVDESIAIDDVIAAGKLLTLTADKAVELGFAQGLMSSQDELLAHLDLAGAEVVTLRANWGENFVRFLNNPVVAGMLMTMIIFGIIAEVQTAGWGLPGSAALIALTLFLGGRYVVGLVGFEEVILLGLGAVLILIEIFAIPGFGVVGLLGICSVLASLVMAFLGRAPSMGDLNVALTTLAASLIAAILLALVFFRFVDRSPMWSRVKLATNIDRAGGFVASDLHADLEGVEGIAVTDLRPAGAAEIAGQRYDVVSEAPYIERGTRIRVFKHEGYRIVVRAIPPSNSEAS